MTITLAQILREFALTGRETFRAVEAAEVAEFARKFRAREIKPEDGSDAEPTYELEPITVPIRLAEDVVLNAPVLAVSQNDTISAERIKLKLTTDIALATPEQSPVGAAGDVTAESVIRQLLGIGEADQPQIQATLRDGLEGNAARLEVTATFERRPPAEGIEQIKDRALAEMRRAVQGG